jgi:hypothetical protein
VVDFSTSAGVITTLASGASTPAATDTLRLVAVGNALVLFVNDVEEVRTTDPTILSGQAGIFAEGDATPLGRLDDFGSGDLVNDDLTGEGVWVHERGGGSVAYMTSDSGAQYTPPVTLAITFTPLELNSEVRVYLTGTNSEVAGVENSGTSFVASIPSGIAVDYKVVNPGFLEIFIKNLTFTSAQTVPINQQIDRNFDPVD